MATGMPVSSPSRNSAPSLSSLRLRQLELAEYAGMDHAFAALARRAADANPHMSPAHVTAASALVPARNIIILAVVMRDAPDQLLGVWAFSHTRPAWAFGMPVLTAPVMPLYDTLSLPVVDAAQLEPVLGLMLAHLGADPVLPKLIRCPSLATGSSTGLALASMVAGHGRMSHHGTWSRAILRPTEARDAEAYLRASMGPVYRKYIAKRRSLAQGGKVDFMVHRGPAAIAALPRFLALEAAGWKGQAGTAMACHPRHLAYATALVAALARQDEVVIAELRRDGVAISMGLLTGSGGTFSFIKSAYDEAARRFAPGFLLHMDITAALMADPAFQLMDSAMDDTGNSTNLPWHERRAMAHGLLALGTAPGMWMASHGLSLRQKLRMARRRWS